MKIFMRLPNNVPTCPIEISVIFYIYHEDLKIMTVQCDNNVNYAQCPGMFLGQ